MIFIMDIMPTTTILKTFEDRCPHCQVTGDLRLVMRANCFRLFFIPIIKWGKCYTLEHSCGAMMEISEEDAIALRHVGVSTDKISVKITPQTQNSRCPRCGSVLEPSFVRCPYCKA